MGVSLMRAGGGGGEKREWNMMLRGVRVRHSTTVTRRPVMN